MSWQDALATAAIVVVVVRAIGTVSLNRRRRKARKGVL